MSIKVKLLLPDNLQSAFLRGAFIQDGALYFTGVADQNPTRDTNRTQLTFGFSLVDSNTFLPVPLKNIISLELSNDPQFSANSVVTIADWPSDTYDPTLDYTTTLNPQYFFDPTQSQITSQTTAAGSGFFYVENWPLSANGGLSTVYFKATVMANDDASDTATYPEGYGIFDQIYWQDEPPSAPGKPIVCEYNETWTGRRTAWRFASSEEPSTGLYGSGVARYLGSIVEIRAGSVASTQGSSAVTLRTLAPKFSAASLTTTGFRGTDDVAALGLGSFIPDSTVGTANYASSFAPSSNLVNLYGQSLDYSQEVSALSASFAELGLTAGNSISLYTNQLLNLTATTPDFFVQSHVVWTPTNLDSAGRLVLKAYLSGAPVAGLGADEVMVSVRTDANGNAFATMIRLFGGAIERSPEMSLPNHAYAALTSSQGGVIELYIDNKTGNSQMLAEAFFSQTGSEESIFLGSYIFTQFNTSGDIGGAVALYADYGEALVTFNEIAFGNGRLVLGADFGDCSKDFDVLTNHPSTDTNQGMDNWSTDLDVKWTRLIDNDAWGSSSGYLIEYGIFSYLNITTSATASNDWISTKEIQSVCPSFSDRTEVALLVDHHQGEFYVAFSADDAIHTTLPMGINCDPYSGPTDKPVSPTVLVSFNMVTNQIKVYQRLIDNTLTAKVLDLPYAPLTANVATGSSLYYDNSFNLVVEINNTQVDGVDGSWLTIRFPAGNNVDDVTYNVTRLEMPLPSAILGCGYFVAVGTRSPLYEQIMSDFGFTGNGSGSITLYNTRIWGLPPINPLSSGDLMGQRHLQKSSAGQAYAKSCLGQHLLAGLTDAQSYTDNANPVIVNTTALANVTVVAATTGANITTTAHAPLVVDGNTVINGDYVLVKDQTDPTQNDIYVVTSAGTGNNGTWTKQNYITTGDYSLKHVDILNGSLYSGTRWYIEGNATAANGAQFYTNIFMFQFGVNNWNNAFGSIAPALFEIGLDGANAYDSPLLRFYSDANNKVGGSLTNWIKGYLVTTPRQALTALDTTVPYQWLVQFDISNSTLEVVNGGKYWVAVSAPRNISVRLANGGSAHTDAILGFKAISGAWFKLHAKYIQRHDNVYDGAMLQTRVRAESHARISSQASALSQPVTVDIVPPQDGSSGRPSISTVLAPSARSVILSITATDSASGLKAFRVGKERISGGVDFGAWQPASLFKVGNNIQYVVYLNEADMSSQTDGPRKIWAQTMDMAGNISESYPLTVNAQPVLLVDTVPPTGSASFIDASTGSGITMSGNRSSTIMLTGDDRVTGVKDIRFRSLGAGTAGAWSSWFPYNPYIPYAIDSGVADADFQDGLRRLEAQYRDYGNNAAQSEPMWDSIYATANVGASIPSGMLEHPGVIFIAACKWQSTIDTAPNLYLSAIHHEEFSAYNLSDSGNANYAPLQAFYASSVDAGSVGRLIAIRPTDTITLQGDLVGLPYTINDSLGVIVFTTPLTAGQVSGGTILIERESALLYRWDGNAVIKIADLGPLGEQAILSLCPISSHYLILGGGTGNIWQYDGRVIRGPVYTATYNQTPLPITCLFVNQFPFELDTLGNPQSYIYAGTGNVPRLFRASTETAAAGLGWEQVASMGYLTQAHGSVTCMTSAFGNLFIGTTDGKILRYERKPITGSTDITEFLHTSIITNSNVGNYEAAIPPIASLLPSGGLVFAGLGDRPEVWSYALNLTDNPADATQWATVPLDGTFSTGPSSAQYYSTAKVSGSNLIYTAEGRTAAGESDLLASYYVSDGNTASGFYPFFFLNGGSTGTVTQYTFGSGTDWEQVISGISPLSIIAAVKSATTGNVTLSGFQTIDGIAYNSSSPDKTVLVKNQTNPVENGVYLQAAGSWTRHSSLSTAVTPLNRMTVKVLSGTINIGSYWLLSVGVSAVVGTDPLTWYEPTYMVDLDMLNLSGGGKQGFSVADGYHYFTVAASTMGMTVTSGNQSISKSFGPAALSAFSFSGEQYATNGVNKIWGFNNGIEGSTTMEDRGPYFIGINSPIDTSTAGSANGWIAQQFVTSITPASEAESYTASFSTESYYIQLEIDGPYGEIVWAGTPFEVNTQSKLYIRASGIDTIQAAWLDTAGGVFENWSDAQVLVRSAQNEYSTFVIEPSWSGQVASLALRVPANCKIDYIAIAGDDFSVNFRDNLTPVRVGVEGRRLKVWVGRTETPFIDQPLFLTLPTSLMQFQFGKIDINEPASTWGYSRLKYLTGKVCAPVARNVQDFSLLWRFPSTGGVRTMLNHNGTAWALTDGSYQMRIADNPDDRGSKCFVWLPDKQVFMPEIPPYPRKSDGTGVIRPLFGISFRNTLVVGGQHGQLLYPSS